jgi:MFS family permease
MREPQPSWPKPFWNASIVALLVTVFSSACGAVAGVTALGIQVYDLTHRELDLGLLGLAEFAPAALLVLVTGTVADRFDRVRVTASGAVLQAVVALALAAYALREPRSVAPIFALVLVFGAGRAFLAPAARALPADVVDSQTLPLLTARRGATWQSAIIVGPVIAGGLYPLGAAVPYFAMAVLLAIAAVSVLFVRTLPVTGGAETEDPIAEAAGTEAAVEAGSGHLEAVPTTRGRLHEALEGLRFIRHSPILLGAISLDLFAVLFGGAVALLPAIAIDRLGVGSVGLGWLRAAGGIGAASVTLVIARRPFTRHVGPILLVAVAIFGAATIALGATTIYAVAFIAMLVLSGADAISVFIRSTLVPLITPRDKRGRVNAVESVFIGASNELGAFESGVVGQVLGAPGAIVIGGVATLVVAGTYCVAFPSLRSVDGFPGQPS